MVNRVYNVSYNQHITKVLDIGARFGIHPSWKNFVSDINLFLIEADKQEVKRLNKKYYSHRNIKTYKHAYKSVQT